MKILDAALLWKAPWVAALRPPPESWMIGYRLPLAFSIELELGYRYITKMKSMRTKICAPSFALHARANGASEDGHVVASI